MQSLKLNGMFIIKKLAAAFFVTITTLCDASVYWPHFAVAGSCQENPAGAFHGWCFSAYFDQLDLFAKFISRAFKKTLINL